MNNHVLRSCVSLLLIGLFASTSGFAQNPAAMVYASGNVTVNGTRVSDPTAVFPGAVIETGADSTATLRADRTTAVVAANSKITLNGAVIELLSGTVRVSTTNAARVQVAQITITPMSGSADYRATLNNCNALISAEQQQIALVGERTTVLESGRSQMVGACIAEAPQPSGVTVEPPPKRKLLLAFLILGGALAALLSTQGSPASPVSP
jgi:hypothetical protein